MKHSIRWKLLLTGIALILGAFLIFGILNYFFLGKFYQTEKTKTLMDVYKEVNQIADTSTDFSTDIMKVSVENNIQILITDSDFNALNSTSRDTQELSARLFGYYTGFFNEGYTILKKTDNYTLQTSSDHRISLQYLEIWGQLDNSDWFLIRTPLESMQDAAKLSIRFFIFVAIIVAAAAAVIIWFFSKRFTKPVTQLTELSKRMANQDFSAKYTGETNDEIGVLGTNFNMMSDELEGTISELKSANTELQKDNERKTQIDEVRKEFLNNVSHELKTPIALIQGYAEGLKDNVADDEESRDFYCDVIVDEATKMNTMVKKLLTLNQLEFGNDPVQMDRFDLVQLISGVVQGMQILIDQKEAKLSFVNKDPVWVWGDEFKIEEVVTNFLSNALNHLDYDKKIEILIKQENGIVTTSVFNTGDPIPEEDLDKVFEKFFKVDKARTREYGGSGIGLSIVKAVMDAHHQKCGVENYNNGVAFWFTLEGK
jgi:two-component system sensor histidine kinase VanS